MDFLPAYYHSIFLLFLQPIILKKQFMKNKDQILYDKSTEEKIKIAAEKLFMEKGFSSTRTRDIADAADINLALLNYYYRSKKNLFDTIMMEKLGMFFDTMLDVMSKHQDDYISLFNGLMNRFTDMMTAQPKLSYFLMSELQQNPDFFTSKLNIREKARNLSLLRNNDMEVIQMLMDVMALTLYPFIIKEAIGKVFELNEDQCHMLEYGRRERISEYISAALKK